MKTNFQTECFFRELYTEHIDSATFHYEQRIRIYSNPETTWLRIGEFEERFEANIDALADGGESAVEICRQQAIDGDTGALHAAVCVFCRLGRKDMILDVFEKLDPEDIERMQAVSDALNLEMPSEWKDDFVSMLSTCGSMQHHIIARLIGYCRFPATNELLKALSEKSSVHPFSILWALGRLNDQAARPLILSKYLRHEDETVSEEAAHALLRMGEPEALKYCLQSVPSQDWPDTFIGISAGRSALAALFKKAAQEKPKASCLIGLGLLGDISATETLLGRLADSGTAEAAALALNLMTGAEIYEDAFIPDEMDEDELFPEELEKFRQGQPPTKPDGAPYGVTITRLSQKPEDWQKWWANNASQFKAGNRYRSGKLFTPACLLENIEYEKTPHQIRQLAYEELVIRYGVDFPFEANMYVTQQKRIIKDIARWVAANSTRFQPGAWYFAGQVIS